MTTYIPRDRKIRHVAKESGIFLSYLLCAVGACLVGLLWASVYFTVLAR